MRSRQTHRPSPRRGCLALLLISALAPTVRVDAAGGETFADAAARGAALMAEGDCEAAIKALRKAEKLAPEPPGKVLLDLAICFNRVGRFERSVEYARAALAASEDRAAEINARFLIGLGLVGPDPAEAERQLRSVLELSGGSANAARLRLGEVLRAQGRNEEACRQFAEFLEVQPGGALAAEARWAMTAMRCGAGEAAAARTDSWSEVRTARFRVVANVGAERAAGIATGAELLLAVLERLAPGEELFGGEPITLFGFADAESFAPYRLPGWGAGYLVPHPHGIYAAFEAGHEPTRLVYRQLIQHSLEVRYPGVPAWFRQGVAELYSNLSVDGGAVRLGLPIASHLFFLGPAAGEPRLRRVLEAGADEAAELESFSAWSWAVVHYLALGGSELRGRVGDYLRLIAELERPRRAFERAFRVTPVELEERVLAHVRSQPMPYARFAPGTLAIDEGTTRRLSPAESDLALVELVLHTAPERAGGALETARRLAAEDPGSAPARVTLGEAEAAAGTPAAALTALREAVALDAASFKAQLLLGSVLLERAAAAPADGGGAFDEAVSALERAVDLRPDSFPAWERLSYAYAGQPAPPDRAVEAAARAIERNPGRTDLVFNLILVRAKRGEADEVRRQLLRLEALGAAPAQVESAREMLMRLHLQEARDLMRRDRLDDAVALLAEVRARSATEELRATARQWMETARTVQQHNRFAERYNEAVAAYVAEDWTLAAEILEELRARARPGLQVQLVDSLRGEVEYWRD